MLRVLLHHNNHLKITFYLSKGSPLAPLINPTPVPLHLTEGDCRMITQVQPLCMMEHTLEPLGFEIEDQPLCLIGLCHMLCLLLHNHSYTYHITCFPLRSSALVQFPYPHLTSPNPTTRSRAVPINSTSRDGVLGSTLRRHPPHLYHPHPSDGEFALTTINSLPSCSSTLER